MANFPLTILPGLFLNGTDYQGKGRYNDANLTRWYPALGPIGGWRSRGADTVTGSARAAISWKTNGGVVWGIIGTHSGLYVTDLGGTVTDITPSAYVSGNADAVTGGGYGAGLYGASTYGTPRSGSSEIEDATVWSLDTWGQDPVGVSPSDGRIVEWALDTGTPAAKVTNSPTCEALVVTPERFLFALATTDPRTVSWCDQEDNTTWTPSSTNQAGSFPLQTAGRLMCGKNTKGGTLLLTDIDAHLAAYEGGISVYGFTKVGDSCGAISRQCAVSYDMLVAWMSISGFWVWNGYVQPIACDVWDYIIRDINLDQRSKIWGVANSSFNEIEWRYCSNASTEIDRCVVLNYVTGVWTIGRPVRTCGVDKGVFEYPVAVDTSGNIYDHEFGFDYGGDTPYATTGPVELGNGDQVMHVRQLIPDDITLGDVTATFYPKNRPDDAEITLGPYTLKSRTDMRWVARQARVHYAGAKSVAWRVGTPRLEIVPGGLR